MEGDQSDLKKLKMAYFKLSEEHLLPIFSELNEEFQIERVAEIETDYIIREIRRAVSEKISNYLRVIETFLNPSGAPMFLLSAIKCFGVDEKENLSKIYNKLAKNEMALLRLDVQYNIEKEVKYLNDSHRLWGEVKVDFLKILDLIDSKWEDEEEKVAVIPRGYFG